MRETHATKPMSVASYLVLTYTELFLCLSSGEIMEAGNGKKGFTSDRPWAGSSLWCGGGLFPG